MDARKTARQRRPDARQSASTAPIPAPFAPMLAPQWEGRTRAPLMTQREIAEAFDVDERTIRNWVSRGMPVEVETPRPLYRFGTCWVWKAYLNWQTAQYQTNRHFEPLRRFTYQHALAWWMPRELAEWPDGGNEFVVVPLRHDHPRRAEQLEIACAGLQALPLLPELEDDAA